MQKPLVIARCEAGQELSAKLVAWECSGLSVAVVSEAADAAFDALLPDATAILHVLKPIAAEVFARAPRLKLVQKVGVGVNTIDLEAARRHGVAVCNMPGANGRRLGTPAGRGGVARRDRRAHGRARRRRRGAAAARADPRRDGRRGHLLESRCSRRADGGARRL